MKKTGYTLVEFMVVLAVMGIVAGVAIYGLGTSGKTEDLRAASREMVGNLRSIQNKAINGAGGTNFKQMRIIDTKKYSVDGATVNLKQFLTLSTFVSLGVAFSSVCFAHPAVSTSYAIPVGPCECDGAICNGSNAVTQNSVYIHLKGVNNSYKLVYIEQNPTTKQITRIYEQ